MAQRSWLSLVLSLACLLLPTAHADEERLAALRTEATELNGTTDPSQLIRLIMIELQLSTEPGPENDLACRAILKTLAESGDDNALTHVRSVFENEPERRSMSAWALSLAALQHPRELQDWRYMVRSLSVVEGEDAVSVMTALTRFRQRANKASWVRQVILLGLQLPESQRPVATRLLRHWTGVPTRALPDWSLVEYQEWFRREYPESPDPVLPVDMADRKWTLAVLKETLTDVSSDEEAVSRGLRVFEKAGCQKCHRRGATGTAAGPDLTSLGWRRSKKEILNALLYPSHELHEEYPSVSVEVRDGKTLTGVLLSGADDKLTLVDLRGERHEIVKTDIVQIVPQKTSAMPEGTLEPLQKEEIVDLLAFLTSTAGVPRPHRDEQEE